MGLGIAYVASMHAKVPRILLYDRSGPQLQKSLKLMDKLLEKDVGKGRLSESSAKEVRARVEAQVVTDDPAKGMGGIEEADMVVEVSGLISLLRQTDNALLVLLNFRPYRNQNR
jgi:3-hydroxybutyryl-CoA dehydrogenase